MLRNKLMTACSVAVLTAALYGCSSSSDGGANMQVQDLQDQIAALNAELGEGEELTPEALAALIAAKADAEAALADAMIAHQAALDQAAMDAETAKTAALAAAAMEAMTAHEAALAAAAMEAMTAHEAALATAAMEAVTAQEAALAAAAMEAMTAREAALAAAAMEAMTAREAALAAAAMEAMTAHEAALAAAAMEAMTAHEAALAAAAIAAADMAAADKAQALDAAKMAADAAQVVALDAAKMATDTAQVQALADAKMAADAAQVVALDAAKMAADTAQVQALADAKMAADTAQVQALADAKMAADTAQVQALADAKMAADTAQVQALADAKMAADTAQVQALADAKDVADAALKVVQDALDELKRTSTNAMAAAALVGKIARAGLVYTEITADPGGVMPKGTTANGGGEVGAVTANRNAAGMVTVDVNGEADDDYAGGETNAGSSAWNSVTMTKTNAGDDSTDMVVIYTDIEEPSDKLFTEEYNSVARSDILGMGRAAKAQSDHFPTGKSQSVNFGGDTGNPTSFRGQFDGVPGVFECETVPCTLMTNEEGELNESANWSFTPDAPNTATIKDPDAAYAYFGWWLNKPVKPTDPHTVEVFAGGVLGTAAVIDAAIVGTARYSGPAAGKYATKTFTAGVQTDAAVGHFTATAKLTAKFGNKAGLGDGISGTVTGFELDDTNAVPWKVILEETDSYSDANFNGTTEVDFGGGVTATDDGAGAWQGSFYREGAEAADAPSTVVGTFGAAVENARVIGGFGATKQ